MVNFRRNAMHLKASIMSKKTGGGRKEFYVTIQIYDSRLAPQIHRKKVGNQDVSGPRIPRTHRVLWEGISLVGR